MTDQQVIEALATKVMGWHKAEITHATYGGPATRRYWVEQNFNPEKSWEGFKVHVDDWDPLKNPAHSKQVREELTERFSDWSLTFDRDAREARYELSVWNVQNDEHPKYDMVKGWADTEERAIALCALKTVEESK